MLGGVVGVLLYALTTATLARLVAAAGRIRMRPAVTAAPQGRPRTP